MIPLLDERAQKEQEIRNLQSMLSSTASPIGDWKIAKHMEYTLLGMDSPYDIEALHTERQAIRDRINDLQEELDAAE
jgi:cell division protein FtsB